MQGAEAIVTLSETVTKKRVPKSYRHQVLDARLRQARSRKEYKMLKKASSLIPVPQVLYGDDETIVMERIDGPLVKEVFSCELAQIIGEQVAILHKNNIIHGDLTTSNMIFCDGKVFFIDFGLSVTSLKEEDKAVDIHLFKQAIESKHHVIAKEAFSFFMKGYAKINGDKILKRLEMVESRGRHKNKQ